MKLALLALVPFWWFPNTYYTYVETKGNMRTAYIGDRTESSELNNHYNGVSYAVGDHLDEVLKVYSTKDKGFQIQCLRGNRSHPTQCKMMFDLAKRTAISNYHAVDSMGQVEVEMLNQAENKALWDALTFEEKPFGSAKDAERKNSYKWFGTNDGRANLSCTKDVSGTSELFYCKFRF